jgi:putative membrane protein
MKPILFLSAALMLAPLPALAQAQRSTTPPPASSPGQGKALSAKEFAAKVETGNEFELQAAEIARAQARDPKVKDFAETLFKDHTQAGKDFQQAMGGKSPGKVQLDKEHSSMLSELKQAKGEAFDQHFIQMMLKDHEKDAQLFDSFAQSGDDPNLKSFAQKTAPVIHTHLKTAESLNSSTGGKK